MNTQPQKGNFAFKQHGQPLFLSRVDPNDGHSAQIPFKTSGMSWGLASAKLHVSQISVVDRNLFIQAFIPHALREGRWWGSEDLQLQLCFTRQDPTAYPSSEVRCLHDKCIKLASRSCLGKRTVSRNHAILARDFKGNKQFAKKGNVPFKKHKRPCANIGGSTPPLQIVWHGASVWPKAAFHSKHLA